MTGYDVPEGYDVTLHAPFMDHDDRFPIEVERIVPTEAGNPTVRIEHADGGLILSPGASWYIDIQPPADGYGGGGYGND